MSDRDAFREAREHGLKARHETREARAVRSDPVKALRYLLAQYDRVVEVHEHVVMDTHEDRELHDRAVATFREAAEPIRSALAESLDDLLTASEVKVLTETASKVAYALGRKDAGEEIAAAIEGRRASTAHRIPWEAFTDAANTARRIEADPKQPRIRREPCETHCPCICHDGFGGAHPNEDCRDAQASEDRP